MKKYLMAAVALICMTMTCVTLTACDDDDDVTYVRYSAETVGDNLYGSMVCSQMDNALSSAFGSDIAYKRDDSKAIRVCDEVAEKVRDNELVGTINLIVTFSSTDPYATNNTKVIKTYEFPF